MSLSLTSQNSQMQGRHTCPEVLINESVYLIYEAKKNAEIAPGVGHKTDMAIVSNKGIDVLTESDKETLESIRTKVTKPRIEEFENLISQLPFKEKLKDEISK